MRRAPRGGRPFPSLGYNLLVRRLALAAFLLLFLARLSVPAAAPQAASKKQTSSSSTSKKTTTAPAPKKTTAPSSKGTTAKKSGASSSKKTTASRKTRRPTTRSYASAQRQPTKERYREIQQALADRGYLSGPTDGNWGKESVEALKRFQQDQNLKADGKLNSLSLIALGLGPNRQANAQARGEP